MADPKDSTSSIARLGAAAPIDQGTGAPLRPIPVAGHRGMPETPKLQGFPLGPSHVLQPEAGTEQDTSIQRHRGAQDGDFPSSIPDLLKISQVGLKKKTTRAPCSVYS